MQIKIKYDTQLPTQGDKPSVEILSGNDTYTICFINSETNDILSQQTITNSGVVSAKIQYYIKWLIKVFDSNNNLIHQDLFNPEGKTVFIKIDAYALGDNLAWMPYVNEFQIQNKCTVICSTFFNHLFDECYPNILFVKPNTFIKNVYAQYYIGANEEENYIYSQVGSQKLPLQKVAANILGLPFIEIKPKLNVIPNNDYQKPSNKKYICISTKASHHKKEWKGDWQKVVDFIKSKDIDVVVISKEPTDLLNVIDKTGDIHLQNRMKDILNSELFIGLSSGLSWLSWALNKKTMIISDITPQFHEPKENVIRIGGLNINEVDYTNEEITNTEYVIEQLKKIL